jgi:hypothetical protein
VVVVVAGCGIAQLLEQAMAQLVEQVLLEALAVMVVLAVMQVTLLN